MTRTTIDTDDDPRMSVAEMRAMEGTGWDGDLDELRSDPVDPV